MMPRFVRLSAFVVAIVLALAPPAFSENGEERQDDDGSPAYSTARLKVFQGPVWVRPPDSGEWEEYFHNSPVPERARIGVPEGSEAEIQFHGGQFMLLAGGSEVDVRRLAGDGSSFRLRAGEVRLALPREDFAPVTIRLPGGGHVELRVPGKYGLEAGDGGEARLVVRAGEGHVKVARGEYPVRAGEEAFIGEEVRIAAGTSESAPEPAPLEEPESKAGVPPSLAYELRSYGEWVYAPTYGYVWRPRVAAGWSPYYYGRWSWVTPYGWVWISYEPWGWYPYHYGYWYLDSGFGWVWWPSGAFVSVSVGYGPYWYPCYHTRAYFVPATVRVNRVHGTVRWVPLHPGERYTRISVTRTDARIATWDRSVPRGTVYVREKGGRGWKDAVPAGGTGRHPSSAGRGGDARPPGETMRAYPSVKGERGRGGDVRTTPAPPVGRPEQRAPSKEQRAPSPEQRTPSPEPGRSERLGPPAGQERRESPPGREPSGGGRRSEASPGRDRPSPEAGTARGLAFEERPRGNPPAAVPEPYGRSGDVRESPSPGRGNEGPEGSGDVPRYLPRPPGGWGGDSPGRASPGRGGGPTWVGGSPAMGRGGGVRR